MLWRLQSQMSESEMSTSFCFYKNILKIPEGIATATWIQLFHFHSTCFNLHRKLHHSRTYHSIRTSNQMRRCSFHHIVILVRVFIEVLTVLLCFYSPVLPVPPAWPGPRQRSLKAALGKSTGKNTMIPGLQWRKSPSISSIGKIWRENVKFTSKDKILSYKNTSSLLYFLRGRFMHHLLWLTSYLDKSLDLSLS